MIYVLPCFYIIIACSITSDAHVLEWTDMAAIVGASAALTKITYAAIIFYMCFSYLLKKSQSQERNRSDHEDHAPNEDDDQ